MKDATSTGLDFYQNWGLLLEFFIILTLLGIDVNPIFSI